MTAAPTAGVSPGALAALYGDLVGLLGERGVTADLDARRRASVDEATMSPILTEQLPLGLADLVAFPRDAAQIAEVVARAAAHHVPITPRGRGTGNYGQAIPLHGGLVLDTSRARAIVNVASGSITAEAGTPMVQLERQAAVTGQQLWMYPSTVESSLGGFLSGGSGGTGTIAHGSNWQGFVSALDVVHPADAPRIVCLEGDAAQPYVHTYGAGGVIARATVRLEPLQDWQALYASFAAFEAALSAVRTFRLLDPTPRLVSADPPGISDTFPADPAVPEGRSSLRAILDAASVATAERLVTEAGGRVEAVRTGSRAGLQVSRLSYNHPIYWLQRSMAPRAFFHVEVAGEALIDRIDEVHAVYPGAMLHIEAGHRFPIGMLAAPYLSARAVFDGYRSLEDMEVRVHSPHHWQVDRNVEGTRELKAMVDPGGLLNPGKLAPQ